MSLRIYTAEEVLAITQGLYIAHGKKHDSFTQALVAVAVAVQAIPRPKEMGTSQDALFPKEKPAITGR